MSKAIAFNEKERGINPRAIKNSERFSVVLLVLVIIQASGLTESLSNFVVLGFDIELPIWLMCYTVAVCMLLKTDRLYWLKWIYRKNTLIALLMFVACVSVIWSVDGLTTAKRSTHLVGILITVICIAANLSTETLRKSVAVILVCVVFFNSLVSLFIPSIGVVQTPWDHGAWQGFTWHKNTLGVITALAAFIAIYNCVFSVLKRLRFVWLSVACICVGVNLMCDSATSLLSFLVGGCAIVGLYSLRLTKAGPKFVYPLLAFLVVVALISFGILDFRFDDASSAVGRDGTLTGRTELWLVAWEMVKERPLFGHGYGSIWAPNSDYALYLYRYYVDIYWGSPVSHAHNGFLQVASDLGLLIASLAVFFVLKLLFGAIKLYRRNQSSESIFIVALCCFFITHNVAEASILAGRHILWVVFLVFILQYTLKRSQRSWEGSNNNDAYVGDH